MSPFPPFGYNNGGPCRNSRVAQKPPIMPIRPSQKAEQFAESVQADELIVAHHAENIAARLRSVELTATALGMAMQDAR